MCVDLAICATSLLMAASITSNSIWNHGVLLLQHPFQQILLCVALSLCWHISLVFTGSYQSYRGATVLRQMAAMGRGALLGTFWVGVWLPLSQNTSTLNIKSAALQMLLFLCFSSAGFFVTRLVVRTATVAFRKRGRNLRSIVIVGSNRRAISLAERFESEVHLGYRLMGFVDDVWHSEHAPSRYKKMVLGDHNEILELLRRLPVDEVVVALPIASNYALIQRIVDLCTEQGIAVAFEASLFANGAPQFSAAPRLEGMLTLYDSRPLQWTAGAKRLIDLTVSGVALVTISPILIAVMIAIKVRMPGPVFFMQERLGRGKRRFKIFKFRTMVANAEALQKQLEHLNQSGGPTFKLSHDPRITPLGAFLRRTSLDELPQLLNVFLGHMSLVGPRPLPLRDYEGFSQDWHRRRFSVRPGITCLWQAGGRSSVTFERWMELDLDYIDRWSLWLDFTILIKTIPAVLRGSGAM